MKARGWSLTLVAVFAAALLAGSAFAADTSGKLMMAKNDKLGDILTDSQGMTLYIFKKDKPGETVCYDQCAQKWPPLTVKEGTKPTAASGINGKLGEVERKDGSYQVTYNDMPLYYFQGDTKPGEAKGQGVGGVWFVVETGQAMGAGSSSMQGQQGK
jgi:predicted lipoprotein with Yx(FWY)xxD motif